MARMVGVGADLFRLFFPPPLFSPSSNFFFFPCGRGRGARKRRSRFFFFPFSSLFSSPFFARGSCGAPSIESVSSWLRRRLLFPFSPPPFFFFLAASPMEKDPEWSPLPRFFFPLFPFYDITKMLRPNPREFGRVPFLPFFFPRISREQRVIFLGAAIAPPSFSLLLCLSFFFLFFPFAYGTDKS